MMAALFFFFLFLDAASLRLSDPSRPLQLSLLFASLAVLSNVSLFNVYLSLVIFALGLFVVLNIKDWSRLPVAQTAQIPFQSKKILWTVLTLPAVLFNLLVMSQHPALRPDLYEPVTVKITGPEEKLKRNLQVFRVEPDGQERLLTYENDAWTTRETAQYTALKIIRAPAPSW